MADCVLKGASLQAQDSPGGSGCGVQVLAQVQLSAAKVQWLRWGLALRPVFVAGAFCQTPGSLFTETFFNDQWVIGQPGQMKAQGFRISVMGNLN